MAPQAAGVLSRPFDQRIIYDPFLRTSDPKPARVCYCAAARGRSAHRHSSAIPPCSPCLAVNNVGRVKTRSTRPPVQELRNRQLSITSATRLTRRPGTPRSGRRSSRPRSAARRSPPSEKSRARSRARFRACKLAIGHSATNRRSSRFPPGPFRSAAVRRRRTNRCRSVHATHPHLRTN